MSTIIRGLSPTQQSEYTSNIESADPTTLRLGQLLHTIGVGAPPANLDFPAPLYMRQATVLRRDRSSTRELAGLLAQLHQVH